VVIKSPSPNPRSAPEDGQQYGRLLMHVLSEIKHAVNSQSFYNQPVLEIPVEGRVRNYDFFSQI